MDNNTHKDFSKLEIPVVIKLFVLYEVTHKLIFKFPKHERYTLGEKIERTILDGIELFVFANQVSKYEKEKVLAQANSKIELLKILFRISLNCEILEARVYLDIESKLQEIGKMTQGWIKYSRNST
ncbi:MAG: four helix bundle protein [Patescibacteria group bacterium]